MFNSLHESTKTQKRVNLKVIKISKVLSIGQQINFKANTQN